jgi:hypothetical protein
MMINLNLSDDKLAKPGISQPETTHGFEEFLVKDLLSKNIMAVVKKIIYGLFNQHLL